MSATTHNPIALALASIRWDLGIALAVIDEVLGGGNKPNLHLLESANARLARGHLYGCLALKPIRARIIDAAAWVTLAHTGLTALPRSSWRAPCVVEPLTEARARITPLFDDLGRWWADVRDGRDPIFPGRRLPGFVSPNPDVRRDH